MQKGNNPFIPLIAKVESLPMFELSDSYQGKKKNYRVAKILHSKQQWYSQLDDHKIFKKHIKPKKFNQKKWLNRPTIH